MINKITAAIDIGSYNCRMIIVNNSPKIKILKKVSLATNLIKNLSYSNEFTHDNIKNTVKCLTMFSRKMLEYNVTNYRCVATEACRQVINSDFFTQEVKKKTGLDEISGLDHYDENVVRRLIVREQRFSKTAVQIFLRDRKLRAVINLFKDPFRVSIGIFDQDYSIEIDPVTRLPLASLGGAQAAPISMQEEQTEGYRNTEVQGSDKEYRRQELRLNAQDF